eukprot:11330247-Alexandrium_andersonii.AAC.1
MPHRHVGLDLMVWGSQAKAGCSACTHKNRLGDRVGGCATVDQDLRRATAQMTQRARPAPSSDCQ